MANDELNETLKLLANMPGEYRRDTALFLEAMENIDEIIAELDKCINGVNDNDT